MIKCDLILTNTNNKYKKHSSNQSYLLLRNNQLDSNTVLSNIPAQTVLNQFVKHTLSSGISFGALPPTSTETEKARFQSITRSDFDIIDVEQNTLPPLSYTNQLILSVLKADKDFKTNHFSDDILGFDRLGNLGHFLYSSDDVDLSIKNKLRQKLETESSRGIVQKYSEFFADTLKSLDEVSKGNKEYSKFWVDNKLLGNINLADFWLEHLDENKQKIKNMSSDEKANILNSILAKNNAASEKLARITIDYWIEHVLSGDYFKDDFKAAEKPLNPGKDEVQAQKLFQRSIPKNPLLDEVSNSSQEKLEISFILSLVQDRINSANEKESAEIIKTLERFTTISKEKITPLNISRESKLAVNKINESLGIEPVNNTSPLKKAINKEEAQKTWDEIINIAKKQWEEFHLPIVLDNKLKTFAKIDTCRDKLSSSQSDLAIKTLEVIFDSPNLSPEEKAFVAGKIQAPNHSEFGLFLINHLPNDASRKRIINNLMEAEKVSKQSFDELKLLFRHSIRNVEKTQYAASELHINGINVVEFCLDKILSDSESYPKQKDSQIERLNKITDEELDLIFEQLKPNYMIEASRDAFDFESNKYDVGVQLEKIIENTTYTDENGNKTPVAQLLKYEFEDFCKKFDESNKKIMTDMEILKSLGVNSTYNTEQIMAKFQKVDAMLEIALKHNQNPKMQQKIKDTRTKIQRLKALVKNPKFYINLATGALTVGAITAVSTITGGAAAPAAIAAAAKLAGIGTVVKGIATLASV